MTHESFTRDEKVVAGSDRSFGMVMAAAFADFSSSKWLAWRSLLALDGCACILFLAAALLYPAVLKPLNLLWLKFGLLLHKSGQPCHDGGCFLRCSAADRPRHAGAGQGLASSQAAARREQLLDRTAAARPTPETMKDQF